MTFEGSVDGLLAAMKAAAPNGVTLELVASTPDELGWKTAEQIPALTLTVWTPSGHAQAFGLLPKTAEAPEEHPPLIAVSEHLFVVAAEKPMVALTEQVMCASQKLIDRATRPIHLL